MTHAKSVTRYAFAFTAGTQTQRVRDNI